MVSLLIKFNEMADEKLLVAVIFPQAQMLSASGTWSDSIFYVKNKIK